MPTKSGQPFTIPFNLPFWDAIAASLRRAVVLPDIYYGEMQGRARSAAFSIAGVASRAQLAAVLASLNTQLQNGVNFNEWRRAVARGDVPLDLPPHRLDNIFRTNLQTAYSAGRWNQVSSNAAARPFLMYDAINDSRTRPRHRAMDGYIAPINDPIWATWFPPCGYRCRCSVIALSKEQAEKRGLGRQNTPAFSPDPGWDYDRRTEPFAGAARAYQEPAPPKIRSRLDALLADFSFIAFGGQKLREKWAAAIRTAEKEGFAPGVTANHIAALYHYMDEYYKGMNEFLRGLPISIRITADETMFAAITFAADYIKLKPAGYTEIMFRGVRSFPGMAAAMAPGGAWSPGSVFQSAGFFSASKNYASAIGFMNMAGDAAAAIMFRIRGPSAADLGAGGFPTREEREMLFAPDTRFRVIGHSKLPDGRTVIEIEEAPNATPTHLFAADPGSPVRIPGSPTDPEFGPVYPRGIPEARRIYYGYARACGLSWGAAIAMNDNELN